MVPQRDTGLILHNATSFCQDKRVFKEVHDYILPMLMTFYNGKASAVQIRAEREHM